MVRILVASTLAILLLAPGAVSFAPMTPLSARRGVALWWKRQQRAAPPAAGPLKMGEAKAAPMVTGEELEIMMTEWDEPLVIDAFATWCGPCLLMAPEFEKAAQELKGRVRFVKLDTDKDPEMAGRLNVMGLPTLLFLDKYEPKEYSEDGSGDPGQARAVLKDRIEGALRQESIQALCEHHFFGGPRPEQL